jgi:hypothetical protein
VWTRQCNFGRLRVELGLPLGKTGGGHPHPHLQQRWRASRWQAAGRATLLAAPRGPPRCGDAATAMRATLLRAAAAAAAAPPARAPHIMCVHRYVPASRQRAAASRTSASQQRSHAAAHQPLAVLCTVQPTVHQPAPAAPASRTHVHQPAAHYSCTRFNSSAATAAGLHVGVC